MIIAAKERNMSCTAKMPANNKIIIRSYTNTMMYFKIYGAKGYEVMAGKLATKLVDKPIGNEADAIVKGLSDVLESSRMTSSKARDEEKMKLDWMDNSNAIKNQEILKKVENIVHGARPIHKYVV